MKLVNLLFLPSKTATRGVARLASLRLQLYEKKRLWHKCFPVNSAKFLRTSFLQNTSGRLLLCIAPSKRSGEFNIDQHSFPK